MYIPIDNLPTTEGMNDARHILVVHLYLCYYFITIMRAVSCHHKHTINFSIHITLENDVEISGI